MQTEKALVNTLRANIFLFSMLLIKKAEAERFISCKLLLRTRHSRSSPTASRVQKIECVAIAAGRLRNALYPEKRDLFAWS